MDIQLRNGLIFTSVKLIYKGASKVIENIVIDTGAAETIISPDIVEEIGIIAEPKDTVSSFYGVGGSIHNFFSKTIDQINIENVAIKEVKLDFGVIDPDGDINGLLGLDFLVNTGATIDLHRLKLEFKK
jgi:predicted aspartyl protease